MEMGDLGRALRVRDAVPRGRELFVVSDFLFQQDIPAIFVKANGESERDNLRNLKVPRFENVESRYHQAWDVKKVSLNC